MPKGSLQRRKISTVSRMVTQPGQQDAQGITGWTHREPKKKKKKSAMLQWWNQMSNTNHSHHHKLRNHRTSLSGCSATGTGPRAGHTWLLTGFLGSGSSTRKATGWTGSTLCSPQIFIQWMNAWMRSLIVAADLRVKWEIKMKAQLKALEHTCIMRGRKFHLFRILFLDSCVC